MSQSTATALSYWRIQAAHIVAELFPATPKVHWDHLLDLHSQLLHGSDLQEILNRFLECRHLLESDHYIPFYRLRRLIEASLRLTAVYKGQEQLARFLPMRQIFWKDYRSVEEIEKKLRRQRFEHDLSFSENDDLHLEIQESAQG